MSEKIWDLLRELREFQETRVGLYSHRWSTNLWPSICEPVATNSSTIGSSEGASRVLELYETPERAWDLPGEPEETRGGLIERMVDEFVTITGLRATISSTISSSGVPFRGSECGTTFLRHPRISQIFSQNLKRPETLSPQIHGRRVYSR